MTNSAELEDAQIISASHDQRSQLYYNFANLHPDPGIIVISVTDEGKLCLWSGQINATDTAEILEGMAEIVRQSAAAVDPAFAAAHKRELN